MYKHIILLCLISLAITQNVFSQKNNNISILFEEKKEKALAGDKLQTNLSLPKNSLTNTRQKNISDLVNKIKLSIEKGATQEELEKLVNTEIKKIIQENKILLKPENKSYLYALLIYVVVAIIIVAVIYFIFKEKKPKNINIKPANFITFGEHYTFYAANEKTKIIFGFLNYIREHYPTEFENLLRNRDSSFFQYITVWEP
jgi:ATP-dependent Zn protease